MRAPIGKPHAAAAVLMLVLLASCATTGDPNRGGLFGWRENKAHDRQRELVLRDMAARSHAAEERARGEHLQARHHALDVEAQQLREELDRLGAENRALDARLRALIAQHTLDLSEKRRLEALLADNGRWLAEAATPSVDGDVATRRFVVEQASRRNSALHRELIVLLQR